MIDVHFTLPRTDFDLQIKEVFGQGITGIFGPSGSGKTSLLQAISGLAKPYSGTIQIAKTCVFDSSKKIHTPIEKRNIGYVFQEGRLFPHMSVHKNLMYGYKVSSPSKISYEEVIDLLNLKSLLNSKPSQISGGERQRTALGRSLLSSPEILLLDEPFSAVDTKHRNQIIPFILQIQKKMHIPILIVSHELPDLLKLTNRLLLLTKGRCIGHGYYHDLLKIPAASKLFDHSSLINTLDLSIHSNESPRITTLTMGAWNTPPEAKKAILIKCEKIANEFSQNEKIKIVIHANDIALSQNKMEGTTIQNQLPGTICEFIPHQSSLLCIVDVGFKMVVEISEESRQRLHLTVGCTTWCIFKSVAVNVVG
jgi:molybdate transport system ATP-binding protein